MHAHSKAGCEQLHTAEHGVCFYTLLPQQLEGEIWPQEIHLAAGDAPIAHVATGDNCDIYTGVYSPQRHHYIAAHAFTFARDTTDGRPPPPPLPLLRGVRCSHLSCGHFDEVENAPRRLALKQPTVGGIIAVDNQVSATFTGIRHLSAKRRVDTNLWEMSVKSRSWFHNTSL